MASDSRRHADLLSQVELFRARPAQTEQSTPQVAAAPSGRGVRATRADCPVASVPVWHVVGLL